MNAPPNPGLPAAGAGFWPNFIATTPLFTSRSTGGSATAVTRAGRVWASGRVASNALGFVAFTATGGRTGAATGGGAGVGAGATGTAATGLDAGTAGAAATGAGRLGGSGAAMAA